MSRSRSSFTLIGLLITWSLATTTLPGDAQSLSSPSNLTVVTDGEMFQGRWDAVPGASYYEVWTKLHGDWRFDSKDHSLSPFTSSFEIRGSDDRTRFKVRAVAPNGEHSQIRNETTATQMSDKSIPQTPTGSAYPSSKDGDSEFDPQAPPPPPPTGLFAVWDEPRVIRLVWSGSAETAKFSVEEEIDGRWISPAKIVFPRATTALIEDRPMPGPYRFRVRAVGKNGRASEPSRPTTLQR